jgi:hypothetical protein
MKKLTAATLLLTCLSLSCLRKTAAAGAPAQGPTPQQNYRDLKAGEKLMVITPLKRKAEAGDWEYGMSQATAQMLEAQAQPGGPPAQINLTITLDPSIQFGFERTNYVVRGNGFEWIDTARNYLGEETPARESVLRLFPSPAGPAKLFRILFITRVSDRESNTALLGAPDLEGLNRLTEAVRANPDTACQNNGKRLCVWVPLGVAIN